MSKISDLSAMTGAAIDSANDLITMVDMSLTGVSRNKKMTFAELLLSFADTDGTLAANSDSKVATQKAVKTYVDTAVTGLLDLKGTTDCSANPNYPAASKGDAYVVTVAGKIGGASGSSVDIGDVYFATADNAGGTQASVGASWDILEHNLVGAVLKAGSTMTGDLLVPDDAYDATTWNGNAAVPTKNAVRDKIEALAATVPGAYTDEQAQDAIGAMIDTSLTYVDGTPLLQVNQTNLKPTEHIQIACSDEATAITTGTAKVTFRMPYAFTLTEVRASVNTAPTGSTIIIDINEGGTTIMAVTKLSIDASEKTSTTAAAPAVISDSSLADDAEITVDFDQVGSTVAGKGVKVVLIGHRT